jgi:alpha-aminoadipic semialdehyde synthase
LTEGLGILGIRREDKNRWERRAPLAPIHVKQLVREGIRVVVQPSNVRIATDHEYSAAGAEISEDLSPCNVILGNSSFVMCPCLFNRLLFKGVKEVPVSKLLPDRTYMFFSHTIKGQEYNMPLLDACLSKNIQLMDYERIVAGDGNRLVKFGKFAGFAGMIGKKKIVLFESCFVLKFCFKTCFTDWETVCLRLGFRHRFCTWDLHECNIFFFGFFSF